MLGTSMGETWRGLPSVGLPAASLPRRRPGPLIGSGMLRRDHERMATVEGQAEADLAKARLVIDIQGKAWELLGRLLAEGDEDRKQPR